MEKTHKFLIRVPFFLFGILSCDSQTNQEIDLSVAKTESQSESCDPSVDSECIEEDDSPVENEFPDPTPAPTATPGPGSPPTPSVFDVSTHVTTQGYRINWKAATDVDDSAERLEYLLCTSSNRYAIQTVTGCESAMLVMNYTANTTSFSVSGLTEKSLAYYNVIVRDTSGERSIYNGKAQITNSAGFSSGSPKTLTWGFLAENTDIGALSGSGAETPGPSNLITWLDDLYDFLVDFDLTPIYPPSDDFRDRVWFSFFDSTTNRWAELSGMNYVYEPEDDGAYFTGSGGLHDVRADIRIGAHRIDGNSGILAYNFYPSNSDMVIDSYDTSLNSTSNNSLKFRNVLMHELGHGLGFQHVATPAGTLMNPTSSTSFDGPQFHDIYLVQYSYGDYNERFLNNFALNATELGVLSPGGNLAVGTHASTSTLAVTASQKDFVSAYSSTDIDFYSFEVNQACTVSVTLVPKGPSYTLDGNAFNASAQSDLTLALFDKDETTLLDSKDLTGLGGTESISSISLPEGGRYFVKVQGKTDFKVQFYRLDVSRAP